jgi:hypothetical protein
MHEFITLVKHLGVRAAHLVRDFRPKTLADGLTELLTHSYLARTAWSQDRKISRQKIPTRGRKALCPYKKHLVR